MKMFFIIGATLLMSSISAFAYALDIKTIDIDYMVRIDPETGFHYFYSSSNSGYMPRYCLTASESKRGHLMTKDNKLFCVRTN